MALAPSRWFLIAAALCAAFAGFYLARQLDRPAPQLASGTWFPAARAVPDFSLLDSAGRAFTPGDLKGTPTLVFFGFTHCPDVCPTTLVKLAQLRRQAPLAAGLRVVFVSVDPQRDTPSVLEQYVHAFDPQFIGLTGEPAAIAQLARGFGVAVNRVELPGGDYTMDHSAVLFLLDADARLVALFTPPFDVAALAKDLHAVAPSLGARR
ncbi:MAG TPA: SCO family protein [Steroidobacteraceae bacterium]|nr:SCO family protein [Steroidobacteraceae bacterium]